MLQLTIFDFLSDNVNKDNDKKKSIQEIIDNCLCRGSSFAGGKYRIYQYFTQNSNLKERASFLSKEYGTGGSSGPNCVAMDYNATGLTIHTDYDDTGKISLKWNEVAKHISNLILSKKYISDDEIYKEEYKNRVLQFLRSQLEKGDLIEFAGERFVVKKCIDDCIYVNCLDVDISQSKYAFSVTLLNHMDCKILPYTFYKFDFKVYKMNGDVIDSRNFMSRYAA